MADVSGTIPDPEISAAVKQGGVAGSHLAEIARLETRDDIVAFMTRMTAERGFPFYLLCTLPTIDETNFAHITILSNIPEDVLRRYDSTASLLEDQAFLALRTTTTPFRMVPSECATMINGVSHPEREAVIEEMGFREAFFFPVHDAAGGRAVFILLSGQTDLAVEVMTDLHMICLHVYNRMVNIRGTMKERQKIDLSDREIQCLNWTAAGKTSSEIAEILGLSEHTVNHYLNHVAKKLEAVNRIQAVVKAMRLGLIS
ncbi:hypothetical protein ASG39_05115 [Rhizobium sp. Leaf371]|uniref:helix-turn-helix transcriptional regulator n=1 Tax=Rhizobium sp. Leaf371 TaxID=1736355 RepID=UPI000715661F|nr:LuxR family transcriptional regulator [Rhizobium sp. Leaf371]KQS67763.1 hypothetical protein ASG39_05115 [Rhizobium sp. Leaf371]